MRVVLGEQTGVAPVPPHTVSCEAVGLGVGAEFVGAATDEQPFVTGDGPPGGCTPGNVYSGPIEVASTEWTFHQEVGRGEDVLWGGVFVATRGECVGRLHVNVAPETYESSVVTSGFVTVAFVPDTVEACPEACSSRHEATIDILKGLDGDGSGGSLGSGGTNTGSGGDDPVGAGGSTGTGGAGSGGAPASGGAATGGAASGGAGSGGAPASSSGGAPGLDPELDQRMRAFCEADCASFEEIKPCYSSGETTEEGCVASCYAGARDLYYALCPDELLALLACAEEHPGAHDYSCDGTELTWSDDTCMPLAVEMRECVAEQGS